MKYKKNYFICIFSIIVLCIFTITSCGDPTSTLRVYNLTILTDGNGTTDPTGTIEVNNNESTDISAIPNQDYFFDNWEVVSGSGVEFGDDEEADTTVTLTKEDATIRVNFRETVYDVEIDNEYIDENNDTALSFTYVDAEVGGTYHYSIDDQGNAGSVPVTGEGPVNFVTETISGINVSSLDDGTLDLTFYITDSEGYPGANATDDVLKDTIEPSFDSVDHEGSDAFYRPGETISFTVVMGEPGLTVTVNLFELDSSLSSTQALVDQGDDSYTLTTSALGSATMNEGTFNVDFTATDTVHDVFDSTLSLTLDGTPPSGSFTINNDHNFTVSTNVTLNINVSGSPVDMRFANTVEDLDGAGWVGDYLPTMADWPLSSGLGLKTVYGQFRDVAGNISGATDITDTTSLVGKLYGYGAAANDYFGYRVGISSDSSTVVGGAIGGDGIVAETGNATVYDGTDWMDGQVVMPGPGLGASSDYFGSSVAVSADGSVIVVGAYMDDILADTNAGSAYVLYGADWFSQVQLIASDVAVNDNFGSSVAISGDGNTVVVGAPLKNTSTGSVYVYDGSLWVDEEILTASDGAENDFFGCSVAIATGATVRDTIVVGAYGEGETTGAVYVYEYGGSSWGFTQKITASGGAASDFFGNSVAISSDGNTIVVGAHGDAGNDGAVYVYEYGGSSWGFSVKLTGDTGAGDYFGYSVAVSSNGSAIVAGAYNDDDLVLGNNSGSASLFNGSNWGTETIITVDDGAVSDYFGYSVGVSSDGNTVVAGAYGDDDNGSTAGSVYVIPFN